MSSDNKLYIFDTTLRDGGQTRGVHFSIEDKLKLTCRLDEMGFDYIEGGWPGSNPKDIEYFARMKKIPLKKARLSSFSSTRLKNTKPEKDPILKELVESETPIFTIFGKTWDLHVRQAIGASLEENLEMIASTVAYLKPRCEEIIYDAEHYFDGFRRNPEYALKTIQAAAEAGADWVVLCDTNGGTLPEDLRVAFRRAREVIDCRIGIHTHDDSGLAVANSLAAIELGAQMVQGTVNGLGERCGNANLCTLISCLSLKMDYQTIPQENLSELTSLSHLVSELSNILYMDSLPYVGERAFTHKGGIHVSAVRKNPSLYEHIEPEKVGNKRNIPVSDQAGKSNIMAKALELGMEMDDFHAKLIVQKVKELESQGYHFEGADASFELLTDDLMRKRGIFFLVHGFRVHSWEDEKAEFWAEATVKVSVGDHGERKMQHTVAEGTGPVEAMDKALHKALENFYPRLAEIQLKDFRVRILDEQAGVKAVTRVLITCTDGKRSWGTVGVSQNVIEAAWRALVESLEYKLKKDREDREED